MLKPSMASLVRRIPFGKIGPWCAGPKHPENAVQHNSAVFPRSAAAIFAPFRFRDERIENCPLGVGQVS